MSKTFVDPELDEMLMTDGREAFLEDFDRFEEDDFERFNQLEALDYLNDDRDYMDEPELDSIQIEDFGWDGGFEE